MIFDVMVREGHNADGKQIVNVYRAHDAKLNEMLRNIQDEEKYILAVIPLFRQKREETSLEEQLITGERYKRRIKEVDPFLIKKEVPIQDLLDLEYGKKLNSNSDAFDGY